MERLQRIFSSVGGGGGAGAGPQGDTPQVDTSEQVYISSLALLKMLKHGAARRAVALRAARAAGAAPAQP
jgi:26S proteasome regulatory subunit N11